MVNITKLHAPAAYADAVERELRGVMRMFDRDDVNENRTRRLSGDGVNVHITYAAAIRIHDLLKGG